MPNRAAKTRPEPPSGTASHEPLGATLLRIERMRLRVSAMAALACVLSPGFCLAVGAFVPPRQIAECASAAAYMAIEVWLVLRLRSLTRNSSGITYGAHNPR